MNKVIYVLLVAVIVVALTLLGVLIVKDPIIQIFATPIPPTPTPHPLAIDVSHTDDFLIVIAEVPGVNCKIVLLNQDTDMVRGCPEVKVKYMADTLTIYAEQKDYRPTGNHHYLERYVEDYERAIKLPPKDINVDGVVGVIKNGLLFIHLPIVKPTDIPIVPKCCTS